MARRHIVINHIEPDTVNAKRLVELHGLARDILWQFLSAAIKMEQVLSWIIAMYFCPDEDRRAEFYQLVLHKDPPALNFRRKIEIVKGILQVSYPEALEQKPNVIDRLIKITTFRNKIAHWRVDTSEEAMARTKVNQIRLMPYEGSKKNPLVLTKEEANAKAQQWLEVFEELKQVGNTVTRRSSATPTQRNESGESNE